LRSVADLPLARLICLSSPKPTREIEPGITY